MDYNEGTFRRSNLTPEFEDDYISSMPENVITYILDRVPIQYAVRTCTLSSKWRFKWTLLSQLTFDRDFFLYLAKKGISKDFEKIVNRILLQHKGDVTKFSISLYSNSAAECISDWVMFLSRNKIKHLAIKNIVVSPCTLPTHLFSCVELKHLMLSNVSVSPMPRTFHGFPNLLSLVLIQVVFESCTYGELLTRCPLLEILNLSSDTTDNIKVFEFAKLENLRELCLPLCELGNRGMITSFDVLQHMSLFSKLQELRLDFLKCKVLVKSKERFQTLLPCIKALELYNLDFSCANMVSLAYALIMASRNARTLNISKMKQKMRMMWMIWMMRMMSVIWLI
ncbi:F-box/FBD/LRR-repeat protein At1g13570-like isoform X2 [Rutidosis leptorrhynchoides]|uniref:F-box/FBD/LRR-repeat protein At1g13570-like isoform X2 n=1 Tax=Rutidosis leptorrhynchoides TaxID=125765 RepID=UPI003A99FF39